MLENHWLAADELTRRLGLGEDVRQSLKETFERWDGQGAGGAKGEEIRLTSRLVYLADVVAAFDRSGGVDAAVAVARERAATAVRPRPGRPVLPRSAASCSTTSTARANWDAVIAAEPSSGGSCRRSSSTTSCAAIGDFADLKSPYTIGHSRAVADLAGGGRAALGLPDAERVDDPPGRAGARPRSPRRLQRDLGQAGPLNRSRELERVRLHPYLTERMLAFSPALAPLGAIAVQHHERLDGSGYPRGLSGNAITRPGGSSPPPMLRTP